MGSGAGDDIPDRAARENPALMQHYEVVARHYLV